MAIVRKIIQTMNDIYKVLKQKAHELKDRLDEAADLSKFANFFRSLAGRLQANKNDLFKFMSSLEQSLNGAMFHIIKSVINDSQKDVSVQTKFIEEKFSEQS